MRSSPVGGNGVLGWRAMDTQQRIEAAKARLEANRQTLIDAKGVGPPCIECAHYRKRGSQSADARCRHLAFAKPVHSVITGDVTMNAYMSASEARAVGGLCGPEALLFECGRERPEIPLRTRAFRWTVGGLAVLGALSILGALGFQ